MGRKANKTSNFIGVHKKNLKPWCAKICHEGEQILVGYYETEIEAALAYNEAARKYHGAKARLNDIDE